MKGHLKILVCIGLLFSSIQFVNAQETEGKKKVNGFRFGLGLEAALPLGNLDSYVAGGGLTARFTKGIAPGLDLTFIGGGIGLVPEDVNNANVDTKASIFIPVKAGLRIMAGKTFYLTGEAGITFTKVYGVTSVTVTQGGATINKGFVNDKVFTYAPGAGLRFGSFDLGARYEGYEGGGLAALRIGLDF